MRVCHLLLFHFHIHNLGKLVNDQRSLIPQLIGLAAADFNYIDLFIQCYDFLGQGIDPIHTGTNFRIDILLQFLQIPGHGIEIFCQ